MRPEFMHLLGILELFVFFGNYLNILPELSFRPFLDLVVDILF